METTRNHFFRPMKYVQEKPVGKWDTLVYNPCANGICIAGIDSFTCDCDTGWEGDLCDVNIDDCVDNPCGEKGACVDGIESFTCKCHPGWDGENCTNNIRCDPNPCQHGGSCRPTIDGSDFTCDCEGHWTGPLCTDGCRIK